MSAEWMVVKWVKYCEKRGIAEKDQMLGVEVLLTHRDGMLDVYFDRLASVIRSTKKSPNNP